MRTKRFVSSADFQTCSCSLAPAWWAENVNYTNIEQKANRVKLLLIWF